jgi:hypothetical protein
MPSVQLTPEEYERLREDSARGEREDREEIAYERMMLSSSIVCQDLFSDRYYPQD